MNTISKKEICKHKACEHYNTKYSNCCNEFYRELESECGDIVLEDNLFVITD
jgi:hypothetical protein